MRDGQVWKFSVAALTAVVLSACSLVQPPDTHDTPNAPDAPAAPAPAASAPQPTTLKSTDDMVAKTVDFGPRDKMPGAALYAENCAACHNGAVPKAPHLTWLEMMSPRAIVRSLENGLMQAQGVALSAEQKRHIAEYITREPADADPRALASAPQCSGPAAQFDLARPPAAVGWGHDTSRFVPANVAQLDAEDIGRLKLKWAYGFPGALRARSQPAVGMGAVFVGSQDGSVYAFDLATGCQRWRFQAAAEVRTAIVLSTAPATKASPPVAYFGDIVARLYAVNALTGELIWSRKADEHPAATLTGTAALVDDRLFVPVSSLEVIPAADPKYECCTFRGKILAVDARSGETIWEHYSIPETPRETSRTSIGTRVLSPSGAPIWSSPAVDRRRNVIYFGTGENYSSPADNNSDSIMAVDMATGKRLWQRQSTAGDAWNVACMMENNPNCPAEDGPDFDHGASMILATVGSGAAPRQVLLAGHKDGSVFGLDPDANGKLLWTARVGRGSIQGGVHFGMAAEGSRLYVPINDMNDTGNGDVLDPALARPGMHAIDAATGKVLWSTVQKNVCPPGLKFCDPGISAAVTATPGAVFAGHLDGFVRAYDGASGKLLWEHDTKAKIRTVNGLETSGGSMSGAGPAVADGHVIVNSGYGLYSHSPGNLLLVYSVDGK
jgi:polyvinyl alcohol dehydrogenase (cytochrome)